MKGPILRPKGLQWKISNPAYPTLPGNLLKRKSARIKPPFSLSRGWGTVPVCFAWVKDTQPSINFVLFQFKQMSVGVNPDEWEVHCSDTL